MNIVFAGEPKEKLFLVKKLLIYCVAKTTYNIWTKLKNTIDDSGAIGVIVF